jgi:hypothetical protein
MATEFSAAFLDCGLFLRSTRQTPKYQGDCTLWDEYDDWGLGIKSSLMQFVGAQMDALRDWFYFNWKVNASVILVCSLILIQTPLIFELALVFTFHRLHRLPKERSTPHSGHTNLASKTDGSTLIRGER